MSTMQLAVADREVPAPCRHWLAPSRPLPPDLTFLAHRPTGKRTAAWVWLVIAGMLGLGTLGMLAVQGPRDLLATLGGLAVASGALSAWCFSRDAAQARAFSADSAAGRWRLGRFWSADHFLLRLEPDRCFVVAREPTLELDIGRRVSDSGQAQGQLEMWLQLKSGDQRFVEYEYQVSNDAVSERRTRQLLEQRRDAFAAWLRTGESRAVVEALEALEATKGQERAG